MLQQRGLTHGCEQMSFWPDRARLAMSFVVNVEEGAEASVADGDKGPEAVDELGIARKKPLRNLANESNYRYGLAAGAPRVHRDTSADARHPSS